jgi:hypothetical protein
MIDSAECSSNVVQISEFRRTRDQASALKPKQPDLLDLMDELALRLGVTFSDLAQRRPDRRE